MLHKLSYITFVYSNSIFQFFLDVYMKDPFLYQYTPLIVDITKQHIENSNVGVKLPTFLMQLTVPFINL